MMKIYFLFCVYVILTHGATVKDYFNGITKLVN
jgi:hypothetical protein